MNDSKEKCNCDEKINDGFFDISCPIHDKNENELTNEERQKSIERLIAHAKSLKW